MPMLDIGRLRRQHLLMATLYVGLRRQHCLVATAFVGLCRQHCILATALLDESQGRGLHSPNGRLVLTPFFGKSVLAALSLGMPETGILVSQARESGLAVLAPRCLAG